MGKLKGFCFCVLFVGFISALCAQEWKKDIVRDNWGDVTGYAYFQYVTCTGRGTNGESSWRFGIGYSSSIPNTLVILIQAIGALDMAPVLVIFDEEVTVSLREGNNTKTFKGILSSELSKLNHLGIACMDTQIINELRRNANFTILVEGKNNQWYVRANIKGNMPGE